VRDHRALVRLRAYLQGRITSVKNKLRRLVAHYNADRKDLFSRAGRAYLARIELSAADRLGADLLSEELDQHAARLKRVDQRLDQFGQDAPVAEREARAVLATIPCVGPVTVNVVLAEAGDVRRFGSGAEGHGLRRLGARNSAERRSHQAAGDHQDRLAPAPHRVGGNGLATDEQDASLGAAVRATQTSLRSQEGHRRRGPSRMVRDGVVAQERPSLRPNLLIHVIRNGAHPAGRGGPTLRPITQRRRRPRHHPLSAAIESTDAILNGGAFRKHASRRAPAWAAPRIDG